MDELIDIHADAMAEFDQIYSAQSPEREQCVEDRRFYSIAGAQWEGILSAQYENRVKMEVNKIQLSLIRIFNEYRNNRITVNFIAKDGSDADALANTANGLYRTDEADPTAAEAYDNAFEEAVGGGIGAWRLRSEYEDEEDPEDERQRIRIEPIFDADTAVFFDLGAQRQDKSDAKKCFVLTSMTHEAFEDAYGHNPTTWPTNPATTLTFDWATPDLVYIAEYYVVEKKEELVHFYKNELGEERKISHDDLADIGVELRAMGFKEHKKRKFSRQKVHKYILSGLQVEEDVGIIAGKHIPVVPVYGKRWYVSGVERYSGHVRQAKDMQRLKNMQVSSLAELAAYSGREKPIFTPAQIAKHGLMWSEDNVKNYPYLLREREKDLNGNVVPAPMEYTRTPPVPQALAALIGLADGDMREMLGNQQGGDIIKSNVSENAVQLVQQRLDMQSYIYISNFAKAVKRCGDIWLSMAKELYVEDERKMRGTGEDGTRSGIVLNRPIINKKTGAIERENDFSRADFDVVTDVGPSSASKKTATVRSLLEMLKINQNPENADILGSMIMLNMEGEGIADVRKWFRAKLVRLGALTPTDDEKAELDKAQAQQQPDPQAQYLLAAAQEASAKAVKSQSDTLLVAARAELTNAQTAEIMAGMDGEQQDRLLRNVEALEQMGQQPTQQPMGPQEGVQDGR